MRSAKRSPLYSPHPIEGSDDNDEDEDDDNEKAKFEIAPWVDAHDPQSWGGGGHG